MSNFHIGLLGILGLFALLAIRVPIAVALLVVSVLGVWAIRGVTAAFASIGTLSFDLAASWTLSAVPMFLLMGAFAFNSGMTISVYKVFRMWFWWLPGRARHRDQLGKRRVRRHLRLEHRSDGSDGQDRHPGDAQVSLR